MPGAGSGAAASPAVEAKKGERWKGMRDKRKRAVLGAVLGCFGVFWGVGGSGLLTQGMLGVPGAPALGLCAALRGLVLLHHGPGGLLGSPGWVTGVGGVTVFAAP